MHNAECKMKTNTKPGMPGNCRKFGFCASDLFGHSILEIRHCARILTAVNAYYRMLTLLTLNNGFFYAMGG
jgi:hypothetical protein